MTALLLFATLASGVESHPHREVLGTDLSFHAVHGETVALGAVHPSSAPHVEATGGETTLRCPACLLHLQTAGAGPAESAAAFTPVPDGRLAASRLMVPRPAARLSGGPRAPPTSR